MQIDKYIFENFIKRMEPLTYAEIISAADKELADAERTQYGPAGGRAARVVFENSVCAFRDFLQRGQIPAGDLSADVRHYRTVVELLVSKQQLGKEFLSLCV